METTERTGQVQRDIGKDLPLDVAAALLGTKWAEPLNELRPKH